VGRVGCDLGRVRLKAREVWVGCVQLGFGWGKTERGLRFGRVGVGVGCGWGGVWCWWGKAEDGSGVCRIGIWNPINLYPGSGEPWE